MKGFGLSPRLVVPLVILGCLCIGAAAYAGPVVYLNALGTCTAVDDPGAVDAYSALEALASPPGHLKAMGVTSAVPPGTRLLELTVDGDTAIVNFSRRLLAGRVDDVTIEAIFQQVKWTLWNYGIEGDISILVAGVALADFAPAAPVIEPRPRIASPAYTVTISPGHGRVWNGSSYGYQRSASCSGALNREDFHNLEMVQYLEIYLDNDSNLDPTVVRCTDKDYGNHSSGTAWWKMCSVYWLEHEGYPCSVWGSTTDCTTGSGSNEWNDDIRARPLSSDYDDTDIFITLHTNAYQGDCTGSCPTGSHSYYDCSSEHSSWCTVSTNLTTDVHNAHIQAIRDHCDSDWNNHGLSDSNGAYGEIRIPDRAAALIELGFHDTCDLDADEDHLQDNFFRSVAMWGIYKGICDYFSITPAYGAYSSQLVSHDIPSSMQTNQQVTVHIKFRNKGILWNNKWNFKLGAVGDSDPFTSTTRHTITGDVGPDDEYEFSFTLTAPSTEGNYTTDWRMLRESVQWFGATCQQTVNVTSTPDTEPPSTPTNLEGDAVSQTQVDLTWTASTDNVGVTGYKIYRNSSQIDTSPTNNYSDTTCTGNTTYTYEVSAYDAAQNESDKSSPEIVTTPGQTEYIIDEENATYLGSWSSSTTSGGQAYNNDYKWTSTAASETRWAKWTPNLQNSGQYDVYIYYRQGSNRATDAPFTIYHKNGSNTYEVNQTTNGGQWNLLANKPFNSGTGGYVKLSNDTGYTGKVVIADAVKYYRTGDIQAPSEYILDEDDCTWYGSWGYSTTSGGLAYNNDYKWASTAASETRWAKWTPDIEAAANYDIYVYYRAGSNRANDAPYTVYWNGGSQTVEVNQQTSGGQWNKILSSKPFAVGTSGYTKLSNNTGYTGKVVIADAVRWYKVS